MPNRALRDPALPLGQRRALRVFGRALSSVLLLALSCARFGYDVMEAPGSGVGGFNGLITSAAGAAGTLGLSDAGSAAGAAPGPLDASSAPIEQPPLQS